MADDHEPVDAGQVHGPHEVTVLSDLAAEPVDHLERALQCHDCGMTLLGLIMSSPAWVTRRVESVSFRDHRTVRRRVSIDFAVPVAAPQFGINGTAYRLLPLTIMRRKSLVNFDLRDENDASVPLLGIRQNQAVTLALVESLARAVLETETLCPAVREFLRDLVSGRQNELIEARKLADSSDAHAEIQRLSGDRRFNHVMSRVSEDFVMFVLVRGDGPAKRVFKFRYDEPLSRRYRVSGSQENGYRRFTPSVSRWSPVPILAAIGWIPTRIRFPTPAAENAASYHFEVHAPAGVAIDAATMLAGRPDDAKAKRPPSIDQVTGGLPTVDLHVIDVERGSLSRAGGPPAGGGLVADAGDGVCLAHRCRSLLGGQPPGDAGQPGERGGVRSLHHLHRRVGRHPLAAPRASDGHAPTVEGRAHGLHVVPPAPRGRRDVRVREGQAPVREAAAARRARRPGRCPAHGHVARGVLHAARRETILSPWEQGRGVADELEDARHDSAAHETFNAASEDLGFTTPTIKVASAEASAPTLTLDDELVRELRALVARRCRPTARRAARARVIMRSPSG